MRSSGVKELATLGVIQTLIEWGGTLVWTCAKGSRGSVPGSTGGALPPRAARWSTSRSDAGPQDTGTGTVSFAGKEVPAVSETMTHTGLQVVVCTCSGRGLKRGHGCFHRCDLHGERRPCGFPMARQVWHLRVLLLSKEVVNTEELQGDDACCAGS